MEAFGDQFRLLCINGRLPAFRRPLGDHLGRVLSHELPALGVALNEVPDVAEGLADQDRLPTMDLQAEHGFGAMTRAPDSSGGLVIYSEGFHFLMWRAISVVLIAKREEWPVTSSA